MKTHHLPELIALAALCTLPGLRAEIGLMPDDKKPVILKTDERNPFAAPSVKTTPTLVAPKETEEMTIRTTLARLPVGGLTRSYGVTKVLLGSMMVEKGEILPMVIPGQTETLKVLGVTDGEVRLGFIEKDGSAEKRTVLIPVDLAPTVRYQLQSKSTSGGGGSDAVLGLDGVYRDEGP